MTSLTLLFLLLLGRVSPGIPWVDPWRIWASLPAFVNPYEPAYGPESLNCEEPCEVMANGALVEEWYGRSAAGPPILIGCDVRFHNHERGLSTPWFRINDTGGALLEPRVRNGVLVQYYDILWPLAEDAPLMWWNHAVLDPEVKCGGELDGWPAMDLDALLNRPAAPAVARPDHEHIRGRDYQESAPLPE